MEQDLTNDELSQYDPPSKKILKLLRLREIRRRQTIKLFTDLTVYVILLAMVMILSFQYRNPASHKMINTLRRVFVDPIHNSTRVRFDQVRTLYTPLITQTTKSTNQNFDEFRFHVTTLVALLYIVLVDKTIYFPSTLAQL